MTTEAHEQQDQPQDQPPTQPEMPVEVAEALKMMAAAGPTKITRTILPAPGMKYGKLLDLAPDVSFTLPEGAPEPMAFSFFTSDGSEAYIVVCSPAMKAGMLKSLVGGIEVATPGDLAKVTKA